MDHCEGIDPNPDPDLNPNPNPNLTLGHACADHSIVLRVTLSLRCHMRCIECAMVLRRMRPVIHSRTSMKPSTPLLSLSIRLKREESMPTGPVYLVGSRK